jgi:hypothetical protein
MYGWECYCHTIGRIGTKAEYIRHSKSEALVHLNFSVLVLFL